MKFGVRTAVSAVFLFFTVNLFGQSVAQLVGNSSNNGVWTDITEKAISARLSSVAGATFRRDIVPNKYRTVQINKAALNGVLAAAVPESVGPIEQTGVEFEMPNPSGGFQRYLIQESSIMEPSLAARFPELKTYVGRGIDDPTATTRIDVTPRGFHAIILSAAGQFYVDPYSRDTDLEYISYFKKDFVPANKSFTCGVETISMPASLAEPSAGSVSNGGTLKTYRLALACTGEYAAAVCSPNAPTVSATLAVMVTTVNRVSAIYERELATRFMLVANNDKIVYLDANTDPYSNTADSIMLGQNQTTIDNVIGSANYDFGHVLGTDGGGLAAVGVICVSGMKARGISCSAYPVGDAFDVDYVAHEMGHQFGADHPFDGNGGNCAGNGNLGTAYEPGSGSTIMAYAGICSGQNLAMHSDDYFHTISFDQIRNYISTDSGNGCAQPTATGNTPPVIGSLSTFTIPAQTPFALTASATDPDGDTLTYCWEEFDRGPFQDPTVNPRDNGSSPLFRSFPPSSNPTRNFPSLTYILNNQNVPPAVLGNNISGEYLPTTSRTMTFRVTVRDNHSTGGGVNYSSTTVTSVASAGPFAITSPNTSLTIPGGTLQIVSWNVANTNLSPISCATVKISLSTDGGNTFPTVLASSVPNIGSATVSIPNSATTQGRIKVEAIGNIFFDISDANLTITSSPITGAANYLSSFGLSGSNADFVYDYDRDGLCNLMEYAMNSNPTTPSPSALPARSIKNYGGTNYLSMTFHRSSNATDLTYTVQASADLVAWTTVATSTAGLPTSGAGFVTETGTAPNYSVEVRDVVPVTSAPGGRRFLRLRVSTP